MPSERDYPVGYGKPPQEYRWQKGQSGNSRGRPPKFTNNDAPLVKAFNEKVVIVEDGRRRRVTKFEAGLTQLANRAARGDLKPPEMIKIAKEIESKGVSAAADSVSKGIHDGRNELEGILTTVRNRLLQSEPGRAAGAGDGPGARDRSGKADS
jgi:hypothetical protein